MTDKEKIREEVERLMNELIQEKKKGFGSDADDACILELQNVLTYIDSLQEEPVSEDLEKEIDRAHRIFYDEVGWDSDEGARAYVADWFAHYFANWQKHHMEANRLAHCNSISKEQAELEQKFLDEHLDKYNRMPTFLDAIEYGMRLKKEQMMAKAIDATCFGIQGAALFAFRLPAGSYLVGSEVKVIIVKSE